MGDERHRQELSACDFIGCSGGAWMLLLRRPNGREPVANRTGLEPVLPRKLPQEAKLVVWKNWVLLME